MKYKVLLVGNNKSMIDDFFKNLSEDFVLMSTSNRFEDMTCHIKYFSPDIFIYCMHNEISDTMLQMISIKHDKLKLRIPFFIIGSQDDIDFFNRTAPNVSDMDLVRPITTTQISEKINIYLKNTGRDTVEEKMDKTEPEPEIPAAAPVQNNENESLFAELDALFNVTGNKHILVIDDDSRMLKTIKRDLEDKYDVATAINGKVALKFLETKRTDLILLDYEMPQQNGPEVLELLRQNPKTAKIPVIFLTGVNDRNKIQNALSMKPQGYLLKPIDRAKLYEAIENTLK